MRRVNWPFAAALFLVVAVAAGAVHALHVVRYGKIADDLRWQVDRAREDGRPDDAIKFAAQYLDFRPGDVGMMADLAGWLRAKATTQKQFAGVLGLYSRILRSAPDDLDTRQKAAELAMDLYDWTAALESLDILLLHRPDDAKLCEQYAYCLQVIGKYEESAAWYERAVRADPKRVTAYVGQAVVLQQYLKQPDKAFARVQQACDANPQSGLAHAYRAEHLRMHGRLAEAAQEVALAQKFPTDDDREQQMIVRIAADVAQSAGEFGRARELLRKAAVKYPKNSRFVIELACQQQFDGRVDLAIATLREARDRGIRDKAPPDASILTLLGDLLAQEGQVGPLEDTLRQLTDMNAPGEWVQYVQARLLHRRGRWADAAAILDRLRMTVAATPALYRHTNLLLAQCREQLGDATGELDAYRRLLENDPNAGTVRLDFAKAMLRQGQTDEAVSQFLTVVPRAEVSSRAVGDAAKYLLEKLRVDPKAWSRLEKAVDAFKPDKENPNPAIVRAYLDIARSRAADSIPTIDDLVRSRKQSVALFVAKAALAEQVFGIDRALRVLVEAEAAVGDQPDLRIARARLLTARPNSTRPEALAVLAHGVERFTADDRARVLWELIAGFRVLGDSPGVDQHLNLLAQLRPDVLSVREAQFARALRAGDEARRKAVLQDVQAIEGPDGTTARLLDAEEILWTARPGDAAALAKASEQLSAAARGRPRDPVVEFLRGRLDELAGRPTDALTHYRSAFDAGLAERPAEDLLGVLPGKSGTAPVAVLRDQLPLAGRLRPERHRSWIVSAALLYDGPARETFAAKLMDAVPPADAVTLAWLGRLCAGLRLDAAAEDCFRRAAAGASQSPEGWLGLATFHISRGNQAGFDAAISHVREKMAPIEAHLVIGRTLESVRQLDAAQKEYENAAALKPDDTQPLRLLVNLAMIRNRPDEARKRLEQIVAIQNPVSSEDMIWARRTLAVHLAMNSPAEAWSRGLALLDQNKVNDQLPDDDQRARVLVLAGQKARPLPGGAVTARQEAIRILEELGKRGTARPADDLILLAGLYRAEGDETKARQVRERMAAEYPANFACTAFLAREALRDHDLPACERLLPVLRRLGAGQFDGIAVEFQYRELTGNTDAGLKSLTDYVDAAAAADEKTVRSLRCANLIYDFVQLHPADDRGPADAGLRNAAVRLYQPAAWRDADAFQRLVTLLSTMGGTGRAIDLVQQQKRALGPAVAANAYVQILRYGKPGPNDLQRQAIGKFIQSEMDKNPRSTALLLTRAEYLQLTGEIGEAVAVYREVLRREPENVLGLNNLAWALSLNHRDDATVRESLSYIQRAIDLAGPLDELLDTRARILFESGNRDAGLKDMGEAVNAAPSPARLNDYAAMLQKAGKVQEAERALAQARRFGLGVQSGRSPSCPPSKPARR